MEAFDVKRLKELEDENDRSKWMYADLSLTHEAAGKVVGLSRANDYRQPPNLTGASATQ